jgi:serine/threonine-protein kinase RsbW
MKKDIEISSEIDNLRIIEKVIDDLSLELGLTDEVYGNVLVATMEATNNAIVHGNRKDITKVVRVQMEKEESGLIIKVINQGKGFDHTKIPDPTAPENIEKINGRGLFLMERLSDQITFHDEGRAVELKFII